MCARWDATANRGPSEERNTDRGRNRKADHREKKRNDKKKSFGVRMTYGQMDK